VTRDRSSTSAGCRAWRQFRRRSSVVEAVSTLAAARGDSPYPGGASVQLNARDEQSVGRHGHRASVVVLIAVLPAASIHLAREPRVFLATAPVAERVGCSALATLGIAHFPHRGANVLKGRARTVREDRLEASANPAVEFVPPDFPVKDFRHGLLLLDRQGDSPVLVRRQPPRLRRPISASGCTRPIPNR